MRRLLPRFQINGYCSYIVNVYLILLACNSPILLCKLASAAKQLRVVHPNVVQTVTLPFTTPSRSSPRIMATLPKFCSLRALQWILKLLNYLSLYCVVCSCCVVCAVRDIFWFSPHRNCDGMRLIALQKHTHSVCWFYHDDRDVNTAPEIGKTCMRLKVSLRRDWSETWFAMKLPD